MIDFKFANAKRKLMHAHAVGIRAGVLRLLAGCMGGHPGHQTRSNQPRGHDSSVAALLQLLGEIPTTVVSIARERASLLPTHTPRQAHVTQRRTPRFKEDRFARQARDTVPPIIEMAKAWRSWRPGRISREPTGFLKFFTLCQIFFSGA